MYAKIIAKICEEENIDLKIISKGWIYVLTKGNITKYIRGYLYPLNNNGINEIIDDKYAFYDLCKLNNIPIIEHQILWNPNHPLGKDTFFLANKYLDMYNGSVVIKPNKGQGGDGIYHITDKKELAEKMNLLFENNFSISLCPYYKITSEYRVIVLDNEVKFVFQKLKPVVIGNGKDSIKDLLIKLNPQYFKNKNLSKLYNRVLKEGESYEYDWRFNLSKGATAKVVRDKKLYSKLAKFALKVTQKLNIRFVSVDIILTNNKYYLIELNSRVCANKVCNFVPNGEEIVKNIYQSAIQKMFQDN